MKKPPWFVETVEYCPQCRIEYPVGTKVCPACRQPLVPKVVRVPVEEK